MRFDPDPTVGIEQFEAQYFDGAKLVPKASVEQVRRKLTIFRRSLANGFLDIFNARSGD
jgi:hypothetical protein